VEIAGVHQAATAFEGAAPVYEDSRPGYPDEAVDWLIDVLGLGPGRKVVDLAAGTGKFTRALMGRAGQVIAVEPVAGMRRALAAIASAHPDGASVSVVAGVAQALPMGDGTLDAVTVAQGFHWFATGEAVAEMHRVIGGGGGLGLIWNHRDPADPLQAALTEIMAPARGETPQYDTGAWRRALEPGDLFAPEGEFHWSWRQPVDVEGVADRVASVSFIAALPEAERARLLDRVRAVASEMDPPLALPYVADVFAYRRIGRPK
jgi:ubiquinone/menaquinone biosynthesis C-methylase UbiE